MLDRPRQGRLDRPRPDQAKARHNKQVSQAKADNKELQRMLAKPSVKDNCARTVALWSRRRGQMGSKRNMSFRHEKPDRGIRGYTPT